MIFISKELNMRKTFLYIITALIPFLGFSQYSTDSWINIQYLSDDYPTEISWELLDSNDSIILESDSNFIINSLFDTTINVNSGLYTINVNDIYGDGLGASQWNGTDGWFLIQNECQDTLAFVAGDFGSLYTETLTIAPCAPPAGGCLDTIALNYDPTVAFDDGSCMYLPCNGLDTFYVETYCTGADITVKYNWSNMPNPSCRMLAYARVGDITNLGNTWYPYPANWSNTAIQYNGQQPNKTYYFLGMLADSSYTDTLVITTPDCIPGCTDPTALNYNPWANSNDGSCQAPPANCINGESNIIITITPDSYTGETSWELADTTGNILASSPPYSITGVPVITEVCVPNGTVVEFTLMDGFGDGLCGSCYGGVDGSALVQTLCGDTILSIQSPNANFGMDTSVLYSVAPCTPNVILGCTTPGFTEYNPQANTDDGSCLTPIVLGCVDQTSPDYDTTANTMDIIPTCDYTLVITDAAQDGWFGAWLGVLQDTTTFGPFMMGPYDGGQQTFTISLSALSPVDIMFFAPGNSSTTSQQCGFYLIGPEGDTTLSGGTNAWLNPMLQFPYKYKALPKCGDYCTDGVLGCMDITALNYDSLANMPSGNCIPIVLGCTNNLAFNYDPLANVDDGNCVATIIGCMDSTAFNFNPSANTNDPLSCIPVIIGCMDDTMFNYNAAANTDDGSCYPIVFGCTDILAFNYDPLANTNNGSCIPVILGCTDATAFNFNPNANTDDTSCVPLIIGCTDASALNYDSLANTNNGCVYPILGCTDPSAFNYDVNANVDDSSCVPFIYGCTNNLATNYNPLANTDNGSCILPILGCTDNTMFNYNPIATVDNGSCTPFINGCTDNTMFNYDPLANTDNGSCTPFIYGCTDSTAFNYDPLANTDNGTCEGYVYGCTNPIALNYDVLANTDDLSCILPIYGCTDSIAFNYNPLANTDNGSCTPFIYGCTNPIALNYNILANTDDGSCVTPIYGCTDSTAFNYNPLANTDNGSCEPFIYGCTNPNALNYNATANTDDNSCVLPINGCTDSTMFNYNPLANVDNGSCEPFIYGCNDASAFNFNPLANTSDNTCCYVSGCTSSVAVNYDPSACYDDGSCIVPVIGCTDVSAYNYNPLANVSDSLACNYDAGCYGGPGIPYWLNDGCYAWVIDVDDYCCTNSWDPTCQSMYDYCQLGWPTSVEDISVLGIVVYPNPTKDVITIETRLEIEVELYDIMGKVVISESNTKRLDLSKLPNGIYNMTILYNGVRFSKKVIKQ
jgi:hypothetical protein